MSVASSGFVKMRVNFNIEILGVKFILKYYYSNVTKLVVNSLGRLKNNHDI